MYQESVVNIIWGYYLDFECSYIEKTRLQTSKTTGNGGKMSLLKVNVSVSLLAVFDDRVTLVYTTDKIDYKPNYATLPKWSQTAIKRTSN